jgi:GR25 family glycosyltransferase involved in LPS biosynthesis
MEFNKYLENSPAFVIHVAEKSPERLEICKSRVKNAGYKNIIIFDGVNLRNHQDIDNVVKLFPRCPGFHNGLSRGQIGCALSHLKILRHIVDNNIERATIFEDDVIFHPNWNILSKRYYHHTPKNYDMIYIGNQININSNKINTEPAFCTHAYIVTLMGAKRLLNSIFKWDYYNYGLTGLEAIDIVLIEIQKRTNEKKIKKLFTWYCWNGTYHSCEYNKLSFQGLIEVRNSGLVFQDSNFTSIIHDK